MREFIFKHFKILNKIFGKYRWFQLIWFKIWLEEIAKPKKIFVHPKMEYYIKEYLIRNGGML